jgi:hypothetical protein
VTLHKDIAPSDFYEVTKDPVLGYEVFTRASPDGGQLLGIGMRLKNRADAEKVGRILGAQRLRDYRSTTPEPECPDPRTRALNRDADELAKQIAAQGLSECTIAEIYGWAKEQSDRRKEDEQAAMGGPPDTVEYFKGMQHAYQSVLRFLDGEVEPRIGWMSPTRSSQWMWRT